MIEQEILKRIYPSVVTFASDWRKQVKDIKRLRLKEISLFLTAVGTRERQQIYQALEKTSVQRIPHVHARHDMLEEELDFLVARYKTKVFTIHCGYYKFFKNSKYKKKFFIENNMGQTRIKNLNDLKKGGGICIDLSHLEHFRTRSLRDYKMAQVAAKKYKIGCNHLSAVKPNGLSWHHARNTTELDYIRSIPKHYFSRYINLELSNSIPEQLKFKKYIAKLLAKQWNKKS